MEEYDTLGAFLEHVSLVMDNEAQAEERKVTIMTIHAAKGLEFEHVFLAGWEEGLFPSQRALDEGGLNSLEEERRLAYVAITRAQERLIWVVRNRLSKPSGMLRVDDLRAAPAAPLSLETQTDDPA